MIDCESCALWLLFSVYFMTVFITALYTVDAMANPSVCPSVRHTPVLCHDEETQRDVVFAVG